ncbi:DUF6282 family protein [Haloferax sp. AB510]|uniref:DUF6282 family protein n=1 Tax=Haloferax sp. AB510 TaxID=2934172 RepID=UPI00209C0458|nr:DUF6282 family protein [Haloferax sp. AB510]MCO8267148.1 DUF6282 family protein [Haloferax sp. AB510]
MTEQSSLENVVDLHGHCGPSPFKRRVDAYEYAREAAEAGMDAVVFKEHFIPTVYGVPFVERLLERDGLDILPVGSVVLNYCNGGFNPFMVETAIDYGAKVIWAPTIDARNHGEKTEGVGNYASLIGGGTDNIGPEYDGKTGLYALTGNGELKDNVRLCIEKIVDHDVALFIGHLTFEETRKMVQYADELGHDKMVIDHPNFFITDFDHDQQSELVSMGAYMNLPSAALGPKVHWLSPEEFYNSLRAVGIDNCVVSSDVGQPGNPTSSEALELLRSNLLDEGLSPEEFRTLSVTNPKAILGI